jgi:hypothetical protein
MRFNSAWFLAMVAAAVFTPPLANAQGKGFYGLRDLPRTSELEVFKRRIAEEPKPADPASLYNETQRLQSVRDTVAGIRNQRSMVETVRDAFKKDLDGAERNLTDLKVFCGQTQSAEDVNTWWDSEVTRYNEMLRSAAEYVGVSGSVSLKNSLRAAKPGETCQAYAPELRTILPDIRRQFMDQLTKYQQVEAEKLNNITDVDNAYKSKIEKLTQDLDKARQIQQESTAFSIGRNLWAMILVIGIIAIAILVLVRWFPEKTQLELVQSGQVIQFITVLLLLTVIMALGLSQIIKETTLGTLLGGLGGYVLSQGVGRAAEYGARKERPNMRTLTPEPTDHQQEHVVVPS